MSMLNSRKNTEIDECVPYLSNLSKYAESARDEIRENNFLKEKINQIKEMLNVIKRIINNNIIINNKETQKNKKNEIIKVISNANENINVTNSKLKEEIILLNQKIAKSYDSLEANTASLLNELSKKKEDQFLLENQLILTDNILFKRQQDFNSMNLIQEITRDVFVIDMNTSEKLFDNLSYFYQAKLTKVLKQQNYDKSRIILLNNRIEELKSEINKLRNTQRKLKGITMDIQNNTEQKEILDFNFDDFDFDISSSSLSLENIVTNRSADLDIKSTSTKKYHKTKSLCLENIQMATPTHLNKENNNHIHIDKVKPIPKLNLKQIAFNKSKIKIDLKEKSNSSFFSKDDSSKNSNSFHKKTPKLKKEDNNSNTNSNDNTKTAQEETKNDPIISKIIYLNQQIHILKRKIKTNKKIIKSFKKYYKKVIEYYGEKVFA